MKQFHTFTVFTVNLLFECVCIQLKVKKTRCPRFWPCWHEELLTHAHPAGMAAKGAWSLLGVVTTIRSCKVATISPAGDQIEAGSKVTLQEKGYIPPLCRTCLKRQLQCFIVVSAFTQVDQVIYSFQFTEYILIYSNVQYLVFVCIYMFVCVCVCVCVCV
ncbi:hypothetical protein MHYP_G00292820, partial [Metynnis hypsauchen]